MWQGEANSDNAAEIVRGAYESAFQSGTCAECIDGCFGPCEVGTSSYRGREAASPVLCSMTSARATTSSSIDYTDLKIQGSSSGPRSAATTGQRTVGGPSLSTQTTLGNKQKVKLSLPVFTGALSTAEVGKESGDALAIGAAISGIMVVLGEHTARMDPQHELKNGMLTRSPELERRIKSFQHWRNGDGELLLQQNLADAKSPVAEHAIEKLGVQCLELTWGQGGNGLDAPVIRKTCEAEVRADCEQPFSSGMPEQEVFVNAVQHYRSAGAKFIAIRSRVSRVSDLARALRYSSDAELDLLTIDGTGHVPGMGPRRMMSEWGIPTIYLQALACQFASQLKARGKYVPHLAIAGGFSLEDHVFKALALGAPYFKAIRMDRALMIPVFMGKNIKKWVDEGTLPPAVKKYGELPEEIFATTKTLQAAYGEDFKKLPWGAVAVYTFLDRLKLGMQQLLAGSQKYGVDQIDRSDVVSLTKEAADVTGIAYVMESGRKEAERILLG